MKRIGKDIFCKHCCALVHWKADGRRWKGKCSCAEPKFEWITPESIQSEAALGAPKRYSWLLVFRPGDSGRPAGVTGAIFADTSWADPEEARYYGEVAKLASIERGEKPHLILSDTRTAIAGN